MNTFLVAVIACAGLSGANAELKFTGVKKHAKERNPLGQRAYVYTLEDVDDPADSKAHECVSIRYSKLREFARDLIKSANSEDHQNKLEELFKKFPPKKNPLFFSVKDATERMDKLNNWLEKLQEIDPAITLENFSRLDIDNPDRPGCNRSERSDTLSTASCSDTGSETGSETGSDSDVESKKFKINDKPKSVPFPVRAYDEVHPIKAPPAKKQFEMMESISDQTDHVKFSTKVESKKFKIDDKPKIVSSSASAYEPRKSEGKFGQVHAIQKHQPRPFKVGQRVQLVSVPHSILRDELHNRTGTLVKDFRQRDHRNGKTGEYYVKLDKATAIESIDPESEYEEFGVDAVTNLADNLVETVPQANLRRPNFLSFGESDREPAKRQRVQFYSDDDDDDDEDDDEW